MPHRYHGNRGLLLSVVMASWGVAAVCQAGCELCGSYQPPTPCGTVDVDSLTEASGIAASARNRGVVWTHNDGSRQKIYALSTNGTLLASFDLRRSLDDLEDMAVGAGPTPDVSYLYVGDIGGAAGAGGVRDNVRILRVPEPAVDLSWAGNPRSGDFDGVEEFILDYPDGRYDAETLMVDPLSGDLWVGTKQPLVTRLYWVNLLRAAEAPQRLAFAASLPFGLASGGDISADGQQVVLRREDAARGWARCGGEPIADALARAGESVPVVGPPDEPNGEGLAFLRDGTGYLTISEGKSPVLYFFGSLCPRPPVFTSVLADQSGYVGGSALLQAEANGYPAPEYQWRLNGQPLPGASNRTILIPSLTASDAGSYEVVAFNPHGSATNFAVLSVRLKPNLRVTEVQSSTAPSPNVSTADWWELTSFEDQTVALSGWRFNDQVGGLTDAFALPSGLSIAPGESIVFVERLTPAQFRTWWGPQNVHTQLKIVTYDGAGLSFAATGDGVRLWDPSTSDPVVSVSFGAAANGVTFNYEPVTGHFGQPSRLGVHGVFRAATTVDIGSPGRIRAPLSHPVLDATIEQGILRIGFGTEAGRRYSLEARPSWTEATWMPTGDVCSATNPGRGSFERIPGANPLFFRLTAD